MQQTDEDHIAALRLALRTALAARRLRPAEVARALSVPPAAVETFAYGDALLAPEALRVLERLLQDRGKPRAGR
jgi:hypothetical protein